MPGKEAVGQAEKGKRLEDSAWGIVFKAKTVLTVPCVLMNISKTLSLNKHIGLTAYGNLPSILNAHKKIDTVVHKPMANLDTELHHLTEEELLFHATPGGGHQVLPSVLLTQ